MLKKLKIMISEKAYEVLYRELKNNTEYSHLRLSQGNGCCKSAKVDLVLDNRALDDIEDAVEEIPVVYIPTLAEEFSEIIIVYRNSSLMIKTVSRNTSSSTSCSSHCHSGGCGGCRNKNQNT